LIEIFDHFFFFFIDELSSTNKKEEEEDEFISSHQPSLSLFSSNPYNTIIVGLIY